MCMDHVHVDVKQRILTANDEVAGALRHDLQHRGTLMINLVSSPGSGKTTLLEASIARLKGRLKMACLVGDVATEMDAGRVRDAGIPARQILTGEACHLDARQIHHELEHLGEAPLDILFVENVGNLVCPATFDLGEDFKVALLSVTEGEDKPFKYPAIFSRAATTVITKSDLLPHVTFDVERVRKQVATLNPDATFLVASSTTGEGIDAWCDLLEDRLASKRRAPAHDHAPAR
jgi:hydrogenase nickel incorporation protein HypB